MEGQSSSEKFAEKDPLTKAFYIIFGDMPVGLDRVGIAEKVVDYLVEDAQAIPRDLAKECIREVMTMRTRENPEEDKRAKRIILEVEGGIAQQIYPDLANIDELHMDQIARAYNKEKETEEE